MDSQWTPWMSSEPSQLQNAYTMHDSAGVEHRRYICLHPGCNAFFPTETLLQGHVEKHFSTNVATPASYLGHAHINTIDDYVVRPMGNLAITGESSTTTTSISANGTTSDISTYTTAPAPKNSGLPTCSKCGLTFSRPADLDRHFGVHVPARRKYHCVIAGCGYRGSYRGDKLASHVKNRHSGIGGH